MQLGPVIMSRFAKDRGLATSMLERLVNTEAAYRIPPRARQGGGDGGAAESLAAASGGSRGSGEAGWGTHVAFLVRNYRSHPAIIDVPNDLFYGGRLLACGDPTVTHRCGGIYVLVV